MEIKTNRLLLRHFCECDIQSFYELMKDEEVNTYLPWFIPNTIEEARVLFVDYIENKKAEHVALCRVEDNKAIGYINISKDESHDFGYGLRKEYWHQGMVSEACSAILPYIEKNYPFITATHDIKNIHSGHVMKKIGMKYQYTYVEQWMPKNIEVHFRMYQLNFKEDIPTFMKYWDLYEMRYVEQL